MKVSKKFLLTILTLCALAFCLSAIAQQYFTNTGTIYGAQTYNQNLATPLNPQATLANQYAAGTLVGTFLPGSSTTASSPYTFTNTFSTNIFTAPPVMIYSLVGNGTNCVVTSVATTQGFSLTMFSTNGVTINWEATGH